MVWAMSNGDSTSRSCTPTSNQRTLPFVHGSASAFSVSPSMLARSCRRTKSGASSLTVAKPSQACCSAFCRSSKVLTQASASRPSGAASSQRTRALGGCLPTIRRSSRVACSTPPTSACQSTRPRASVRPVPSRSRQKSSNWPVLMLRPKNCTPVSFNWWASSNIATRTVGSSSAMPDSRTARSAKNKWWLTTTTSAANASRRAKLTWQALNLGHCEPKQLSRVDVTSGMMGERSSRPGSSAKSPVNVACDHASILAKVRAEMRSPPVSCRANPSRCKQR